MSFKSNVCGSRKPLFPFSFFCFQKRKQRYAKTFDSCTDLSPLKVFKFHFVIFSGFEKFQPKMFFSQKCIPQGAAANLRPNRMRLRLRFAAAPRGMQKCFPFGTKNCEKKVFLPLFFYK